MKKGILYDSKITTSIVRLVDKKTKKLIGDYNIKDALVFASDENTNLIQIGSYNSDGINKAVCILYPINKFIYEKDKLSKKMQKVNCKEIKIHTTIDLNDMIRKLESAYEHLSNLSMVTLRLKKRYGPVDLTTIENFVSQFFAHKNVIVSVTKRMEKETKINISLKS